jgi:hypothetical protein
VLANECKRDPLWSSAKVRKMARFLTMRPTQVYKWNWNRKRARVSVEEGSVKRLKYYVFKMVRNDSAMEGVEVEMPEQRMMVTQEEVEHNYKLRARALPSNDDILIFRVERNAPRKLPPKCSSAMKHK